jgi:hypothetical protein
MSPVKESAAKTLSNILSLQQHLERIGLTCTTPIPEPESKEYGAFTFKIGANKVIYRVAKITPAKVGQFVTVWKRQGEGPIQPYDLADEIAFFIISVSNHNEKGLFIFPKLTLLSKGIITGHHKEGKRGIRVYPPWDKAVNKQAQKTQQWQLAYFLDLSGEVFDTERVKTLLNI